MSVEPLRRRYRVLAVCGLLVVIGLVVMAIITAMRHDNGRPAQPFAADLAGNGVLAVVSLGPGAVGENEVHIFITPPGGSIVPVADASATVTLGDQVVEAMLIREGANHYSGTIDFPESGEWTFDLQVLVDVDTAASMRTVVPIP